MPTEGSIHEINIQTKYTFLGKLVNIGWSKMIMLKNTAFNRKYIAFQSKNQSKKGT